MEENKVSTNPTVPDTVSFPGSIPPVKKRSNKWIYIIVVFVILIGVIAVLVFKGSQTTSEEEPTPPPLGELSSPEATPESTPTPSPSSVSKEDIRVQILNGTGIPGEAGYLQGQLRSSGYTNITTGNADNTSNATTQVIFASSVSADVVTEVTTQLKSIYQTVQSDTSRSLTSTDIQIITGLKKGATPLPAETATPTPTPSQ